MNQQTNEQIKTYKPAFVTAGGRQMFYEPNTVVVSLDKRSIYFVQKSGNWVKFAEHNKGKWKLLKLDQSILDYALAEMKKVQVP